MEHMGQLLDRIASGNTLDIAGATGLLGVLFHVAIQPFEFEIFMFHFMAASVFGFALLVYAFGFAKASICTVSFNTGLLGSITLYRVALHRCRKFPGPFAAKITRFYAAKLSAKDVQYYKELAKMHHQYGDFVRTGMAYAGKHSPRLLTRIGPREISILRKEAVPLLYGPNSECLKSTWYGQTGNDAKKCSIHMTRDLNDHRLRRRAWDRGFSIKGSYARIVNAHHALTGNSHQHLRTSY